MLKTRWFSWAGHPLRLVCDRGLRNRDVLQQFMSENGIRVHDAPLETPEQIGRVERHGGIAKAMFRKVSVEAKPTSLLEAQSCLDEVTRVKNSNARHGGFSASQCVLVGQCPRGAPSFADEQTWCDLGALVARHDPTSIFAMQNLARTEAQKALAHVDTSKRVQGALIRNAQPYAMGYQVGDVVCFRRDNNNPYGKTTWSTARIGLLALRETRIGGF